MNQSGAFMRGNITGLDRARDIPLKLFLRWPCDRRDRLGVGTGLLRDPNNGRIARQLGLRIDLDRSRRRAWLLRRFRAGTFRRFFRCLPYEPMRNQRLVFLVLRLALGKHAGFFDAVMYVEGAPAPPLLCALTKSEATNDGNLLHSLQAANQLLRKILVRLRPKQAGACARTLFQAAGEVN